MNTLRLFIFGGQLPPWWFWDGGSFHFVAPESLGSLIFSSQLAERASCWRYIDTAASGWAVACVWQHHTMEVRACMFSLIYFVPWPVIKPTTFCYMGKFPNSPHQPGQTLAFFMTTFPFLPQSSLLANKYSYVLFLLYIEYTTLRSKQRISRRWTIISITSFVIFCCNSKLWTKRKDICTHCPLHTLYQFMGRWLKIIAICKQKRGGIQ